MIADERGNFVEILLVEDSPTDVMMTCPLQTGPAGV